MRMDAEIFSNVQPRLVIEQQSTVARGRSLTSKFMKAIMPVVEKDVKVLVEELKESFVVTHFQ